MLHRFVCIHTTFMLLGWLEIDWWVNLSFFPGGGCEWCWFGGGCSWCWFGGSCRWCWFGGGFGWCWLIFSLVVVVGVGEIDVVGNSGIGVAVSTGGVCVIRGGFGVILNMVKVEFCVVVVGCLCTGWCIGYYTG